MKGGDTMFLKKGLIISIVASFLLLAIPVSSTVTPGVYDPWIDTNNDGIINYQDLYNLAAIYGTTGTPVNKTELLLELEAEIASLKTRVDALEAPESVTTEKIADEAVTDEKLAAGAIPYEIATNTSYITTTAVNEPNAENMTDMIVDITLNRDSTLLIMFSAQAWLTGTGGRWLNIRAMVDDQQADPATSNHVLTRHLDPDTNSHTFIFVKPNVTAGTYTVYMQWWVGADDIGHVQERTLAVLALPA
jgi:hypothetical protein